MALIGVSGKIGSGKDTVGSIIQYLTEAKRVNNTTLRPYQEIISNEDFKKQVFTNCNWEIKKFAEKLKQIVCILTGCSREDLESQEFKNRPIGKQWDTKHKNWVSEAEVRKYAEHEGKSFEEYLKTGKYEFLYEENGLKVYRHTFMDKVITYREMLQKVGTEAMRSQINEDVWVNALFADYKEGYEYIINPTEESGKYKVTSDVDKLPKWIITDLRFPNELKAIEEKGGITIRINRKWRSYETSFGKITEVRHIPGFDAPEHPSETALDQSNFKYTIDNNGTIEELIEKVKEILILEKII